MTFEQLLDNYVDIIVRHGLNVQPGQLVVISAEVIHRNLAINIARAAYKRGACYVDLDLQDPRLLRVRTLNSKVSDLNFVPKYVRAKATEMVDLECARLFIDGSENPDVLDGLEPGLLNKMRMGK